MNLRSRKSMYLFIAIPVFLFLLLALLAAYFTWTYTGPNLWLKAPVIRADPDVAVARRECRPVSGDRYSCYVRYAIQYRNPNICALTSIFVDDACLDEVWRALDDPVICDRLYLEGTRPNCRAYFEARPSGGSP